MKRKRSSKEVKVNPNPSPGSSQNMDLDQLIEERKLEKRKILRDKLQEKLKTIRDRRVSGVNYEPFPEGAFERLRSNEIWEKVLEYVTEPSDITSAYFACGTFADILEGRRQMMMFPKMLNVFKLRATGAGAEAFDLNRKMRTAFCKDWKKLCLSARTVSKTWKDIADYQLNDYDFANDDWFKTNGLINLNNDPVGNACKFQNEVSVNRATSAFLGTDSDVPCSLIRIVDVSCNLLTWNRSSFYRKVIDFLEVHGKAVFFFSFTFNRSEYSIPTDHEGLCEMLKWMLNLKGLSIRIRSCPERAFRNIVDSFPPLESLELLQCHPKMGVPLISSIIRKCGSLKSLSLLSCFPEDFGEGIITETGIRRGLTLESFDGPPLFIMPTRVQWPLKYLSLHISGEESMKTSLLIRAINRLQETLQHLRLYNWDGIPNG